MSYRIVLALAVVAAVWLPVVHADEFGTAAWLRDPRFADAPALDLMRREREPQPAPGDLKNVHTLLRKTFTLRDAPVRAHLYVTGDDYYLLHLNGQYVVQGPEPGYPFAHPYYWLDVSDVLQAGANTFAAQVYYQGLVNRVWNSGDNRAGFILRLDCTYADGTQETVQTDDTWKCAPLLCYPSERTVGYKTQFLEDIDLRAYPAGWEQPGFDDSAWGAPITQRQDHVFVRQVTLPLQHTRWEPVVKKSLGEGRYFYDFGTEIVGHTRIRVRGKAGDTLTVRHGEELSAPDTVRHELRAGCTYEEFPILSGGDDTIAFFDYKAFRYLEILNAPAEPEVWVDVRHHPFNPEASAFTSEHALLQNIWTICRNSVWMGSQGGYLDCPTREKGQYLGDAIITARSHWWLTGDPSLTRKALLDFLHSTQVSPSILAVAPGSFMQEITEYSLQYPLFLEEYYQNTGDTAFVAWVAERVFPPLFDYFKGFLNKDGLLAGLDKPEKWVLVDWPSNLRDDYDYKPSLTRGNTVVNAFYYGGLRAAARLSRACGQDATPYDTQADAVQAAIAKHLVNAETGLYRDAPGSDHSALHANAIPLYFGLTDGVDEAKIFALIEAKGLACGVYIAAYVIEACFLRGRADLGYQLLTNETEHSWAEMLRHGATTCMEVWGPDQKNNTSWLHPWSSSPIYLIAQHVLGIAPAASGWNGVRFTPPHIPGLQAMTLRVPAPFGTITARYTPGEGYRIAVPPGIEVQVEAPGDIPVSVEEIDSLGVPALSSEDIAHLEAAGWSAKVGNSLGVWVSVERQMMYLLQGLTPVWQARIATATNGTGFASGSLQTPLGWHRVSDKIGDKAPWGQVFRSRQPTKEIWKPGDDVVEDMVLTRVLWLDGLEPGVNQGKRADGVLVDSKERCIYIHGTNGEAVIGTPSSHGCIRMLNDDVITAYEKIPEGTLVLITERAPAAAGAS
jgi:hypothetical protein